MHQHKISFCTVCRNRLHHLKETLLVNIRDNEEYAAVEFIVLDYNSDDGLETYIREHMQQHIDSGKLVYYRTTEPTYFHRSHARNMAFKLASGDLICNVDADNYTGKGFAEYINQAFAAVSDICLSAIGKSKGMKKDALGRVCLWKEQFMRIEGYDEMMSAYGFEDYDFVNRLELAGSRRVVIDDAAYLQAIVHPDAERIAEEYYTRHFKSLYLSYIDPFSTVLLFLLDNQEYLKATLLDTGSLETDNARYTFAEQDWIRGEWVATEQGYVLGEEEVVKHGVGQICLQGMTYYSIVDRQLIEQAIFFSSQVANRSIMEMNQRSARVMVNDGRFGAGIVFRNFDYTNPILI